MTKEKRRKINKITLGVFLALAIVTWISKLMIGILYDFGYFQGYIEIGWWKQYLFDGKIPNAKDLALIDALNKRPFFLWMLTQFTWLTTTMMIVFLMFRFFAFDDKVPKWLRWIRSQRTLSIIMIYEIIIAIIFWLALSVVQIDKIQGFLKFWEIIITILVHAVLPILFSIYGLIFLIKDSKASLLREGFVLKGMLWPLIYVFYYIMVALTWQDPYPLSDFSGDFNRSLFKIIGALFTIYALIGLMMIGHNFILLRFNKMYNPQFDADAWQQREKIMQRIRKKAAKKFMRKNKKFHEDLINLANKINLLDKKFQDKNFRLKK